MTKTKVFKKEDAKLVMEQFKETLKDFLDENGYSMEIGRVTYDASGSISFKTTVQAIPVSEEDLELEFERYATMFGLYPGLYLKEIKHGRKTLLIKSIDTSKPKNKIVLESSDGSVYGASVESVNRLAKESGLAWQKQQSQLMKLRSKKREKR